MVIAMLQHDLIYRNRRPAGRLDLALGFAHLWSGAVVFGGGATLQSPRKFGKMPVPGPRSRQEWTLWRKIPLVSRYSWFRGTRHLSFSVRVLTAKLGQQKDIPMW